MGPFKFLVLATLVYTVRTVRNEDKKTMEMLEKTDATKVEVSASGVMTDAEEIDATSAEDVAETGAEEIDATSAEDVAETGAEEIDATSAEDVAETGANEITPAVEEMTLFTSSSKFRNFMRKKVDIEAKPEASDHMMMPSEVKLVTGYIRKQQEKDEQGVVTLKDDCHGMDSYWQAIHDDKKTNKITQAKDIDRNTPDPHKANTIKFAYLCWLQVGMLSTTPELDGKGKPIRLYMEKKVNGKLVDDKTKPMFKQKWESGWKGKGAFVQGEGTWVDDKNKPMYKMAWKTTKR